jgi:hypothetical protein
MIFLLGGIKFSYFDGGKVSLRKVKIGIDFYYADCLYSGIASKEGSRCSERRTVPPPRTAPPPYNLEESRV